jgi:hypothetical protein
MNVSKHFESLNEFFVSNGLDAPPFFDEVGRDIVELQPFSWMIASGTDLDEMADYLQEPVLELAVKPSKPEWSVNNAGHGMNSYGLNFRLLIEDILIVAQVGFGGAYMTLEKSQDDWNALMVSLHFLFEKAPRDIKAPVASQLSAVLRYSTFRGSALLLPDEISGGFSESDYEYDENVRDPSAYVTRLLDVLD